MRLLAVLTRSVSIRPPVRLDFFPALIRSTLRPLGGRTKRELQMGLAKTGTTTNSGDDAERFPRMVGEKRKAS
ncbi:hypothetical protein FACS1894205_5310 [Alphaproteobacteria bacterium]|nr:hypothetical protein FACS1894205_5310 [Alphaproteobacteria bacterium]